LQKGDPDDRRRKQLKRLVEIYAIRARELSEAVARLGGQIVAGNHFREAITEIERLRVLCDRAGQDLLVEIEGLPSDPASPQAR
jgi:hypothetical protein